MGESGSGKTTVSKIVMRAIGADAGQVVYNAGDPLVAAMPGIAIFVTSVSVNMVSDGLRAAMDVRI